MKDQNPIITLDVGGQIFKTTRNTLTKYPSSILTQMFSQGLSTIQKTEDGNYFLDINPEYFSVILDFLRFGALTIDADSSKKFQNVMILAEYLGIRDEFAKANQKQFQDKIMKCKESK